MALEVPPAMLGATVVGGVTLVVFLARVLGRGRDAVLDEAGARARLAVDHPGSQVERVHLSDDRRVALVELAGSGRALVWVLGDKLVSRRLRAAPIVEPADGGLLLRTGDFGAPRIRVKLGETDAVARWRGLLAGGGPGGAA